MAVDFDPNECANMHKQTRLAYTHAGSEHVHINTRTVFEYDLDVSYHKMSRKSDQAILQKTNMYV